MLEQSCLLHADVCRLTYGKLLHWLGLWFLIRTIYGPEHSEFWSHGEIDCLVRAPMRLGAFMSCKQLKVILNALVITTSHPPAFRDHFWEVKNMLQAWNESMVEQFTPSWVSCLDESMNTWTNKYTYPGWMFAPRKLWSFGMSTMACYSLLGLFWQLELVEGKDGPSTIIQKFNVKSRKTVGLLLQMFESIFGRGNVVILDGGICVLKGIVELKK